MHKNSTLTISTLVILVILNCSCVPALSSGKGNPVKEPGTILFSDDFEKPPSGWGLWNRGGAQVDYSAGGLRIKVDEPQFDFWSVAGKNYLDVQIEVEAHKLNGSDNNDFGIICRYLDRNNFYMLVVSSDGYFGIAKLEDGQYSMIGSDQLQYSEAIKKGQAVNRLRADCTGDTLRLYANGVKLIEAHDAAFTAGDVGLAAGAYQETGVEILFDNFLVKIPGD
jgi:hypothetical protein